MLQLPYEKKNVLENLTPTFNIVVFLYSFCKMICTKTY